MESKSSTSVKKKKKKSQFILSDLEAENQGKKG